MRLKEITQPKTPEQQRMDALNANKDRAADAATQERRRQLVDRCKKAMVNASKPINTPKPPTN